MLSCSLAGVKVLHYWRLLYGSHTIEHSSLEVGGTGNRVGRRSGWNEKRGGWNGAMTRVGRRVDWACGGIGSAIVAHAKS